MNVRFYATLRPLVGGKTVDVCLPPGATVRDLLESATTRFPKLEPVVWTENRELGAFVKVFLDGRDIRHLALLDTPVPGDAEIDIFPPVAGGSGQ